jgi:GT2 family glycosyltransferase
MLLIDIYLYIKRRADKRPVYLKNFVDQSHHHGTRTEDPSVSIIIPTRDKVELLRACIESVIEITIYKNYEIVVVDNQSVDPETLQYFDYLISRGVRILKYPQEFNYSAICNLAAANSNAEYLCFLNNDTEIIESDWLGNLVDHAAQAEVGVAGSLLLYPDSTIQHAGIALGYTGVAGHPYAGASRKTANFQRCFSASGATFACVVISSEKFNGVGRLDEHLPIGLNDVDFCIRASASGLTNIVCTKTVLMHAESKSRKSMKSISGSFRAIRDVIYLSDKHSDVLEADPYFLR